MAEPINYSGVTYNPDYYQGNESFADYMQRLAANRSRGVLGGGGMLDTPAAEEITSAPLGQQVQNCPAGYVLRNGACVPVNEGSGDGRMLEEAQPSRQERYEGARMLLDNPMLAAGVRAVMPLGTGNLFLSDNQLEGYVRNEQNEATKSQGFLDYLRGGSGDQVLANIGTNSLATGQASVMPTYNSTSGNSFMEDYNSGMFDPRSAADARTARQAGVTVSPAPMGLPQLPTVVNDSVIGDNFGNGMLSPNGTTYTSSYGNTYDFSSMSPQTQYGLSITDTNNDGSFGD